MIERDHICGLLNYVLPLEYYEALLRRMNRILFGSCPAPGLQPQFHVNQISAWQYYLWKYPVEFVPVFPLSDATAEYNLIYHESVVYCCTCFAFWDASVVDKCKWNSRSPASAHLLFGMVSLTFYPPLFNNRWPFWVKGHYIMGQKRPKFLTGQFEVHSVRGKSSQ